MQDVLMGRGPRAAARLSGSIVLAFASTRGQEAPMAHISRLCSHALRDCAGALGFVFAIGSSAPGQSLTGVGSLLGGSTSGPTAVSSDGSAVAGWAGVPSGAYAFRWTRGGG